MYETGTPRDRRSLAVAVFLAIGIIGVAAIVRGGAATVVRTNCVPLNVTASQEKSALLTDLAKRFSDFGETPAGQCIKVTVVQKASGAAEEAIARGWDDKVDGPKPDVWSPAATSWIVLLRQHRAARDAGIGLVPDQVPSLLQSPLVIAMPRPMAEALGWPQREIGWSDVLELARNPKGWGGHGHPEWGEFRLGKTNPHISTSGLHALIGTYFAATQRSGDLTASDITDPQVVDFVKGVEQSVVHYGDTASTFLRHTRAADDNGAALSYVSAIAVEEKQVIDYNRANPAPKIPLVSVYPREGTLIADHPYAILGWVDETKRAAATAFLEYLLSSDVQRTFLEAGFRDDRGRLGRDLTNQLGVLPDEPRHVITPPAPPVLDGLQRSWDAVRKPARILLVLDVSGSMEGTKLDLMTRAAAQALDQFKDEDEVGLRVFSSTMRDLTPIAPMSLVRDQIRTQIRGLIANGGTALYATTRSSATYMREIVERSRINAILLLTDGRNEDNDRDLDSLLRDLRTEDEQRVIRVFTIGYGADADKDTLKKIADASRANFYDASNPKTIDKVFTDVVSNF
jgi:Ca-activated chloride channel family protein